METVFAYGASGTRYTFYTAYCSQPWGEAPLVYMFARRFFVLAKWEIPYVGQTGNAKKRPMPPNHERWLEASQVYGATYILFHVASPDEAERRREERDLILALDPPMNDEYRLSALRFLQGQESRGALGALALGLGGQRRSP